MSENDCSPYDPRARQPQTLGELEHWMRVFETSMRGTMIRLPVDLDSPPIPGLDRLRAYYVVKYGKDQSWEMVNRLIDEYALVREVSRDQAKAASLQEAADSLAPKRAGQERRWGRRKGRDAATSPSAAQKDPSAGPPPNWETWALGLETDRKWHLFRKVSGEWRHQRLVEGISQGRQANLLKALAEHGGFLAKNDALALERKTFSPADIDNLMGKIKPEISKLRDVMRTAIAVPHTKADPLPYDEIRQGWQAAIQIGYAVQEDREHQGGEQRLRFKTREDLTHDEAADR